MSNELTDEDLKRMWAQHAPIIGGVLTYYLPRPSWPLSIMGFDRDAAWTISQWARYSAAHGCPMTDGDAVRGMTFMQIDDDEDFRAWRVSQGGSQHNYTKENRHVC